MESRRYNVEIEFDAKKKVTDVRVIYTHSDRVRRVVRWFYKHSLVPVSVARRNNAELSKAELDAKAARIKRDILNDHRRFPIDSTPMCQSRVCRHTPSPIDIDSIAAAKIVREMRELKSPPKTLVKMTDQGLKKI